MAVTENVWRQLPVPELSSPVFALAGVSDGVWTGGFGGVAWYAAAQRPEEQQTKVLPLSLSPVTALLATEGLLLAGGGEGIAFSHDGGKTWQQADLEDRGASIIAFAASPTFARDLTVVAATLDSGILRTNDGGHTWVNASFGLESLEMTALVWVDSSTILAAAMGGIFCSRDAGRSWRCVHADEELDIEALVCLSKGAILATLAEGSLLCSQDRGKSWLRLDGQDIQALALCETSAGTLLAGSAEHGLCRSEDGGKTWQPVYDKLVYALVCTRDSLYAGTASGLSRSLDDGLSWHELHGSSLNDLSRLLLCGEQLLLTGAYSGIMSAAPGEEWITLANVPQPLLAVVPMPGDALLLSGPDGLARLSLSEQTLQVLIEGVEGQMTQITTRQVGSACHVWAAHADAKHLAHSADGGVNWQTMPSPFGILPLVALHALPDRLLAATYDPRQYRINLWYSVDDGVTWVQSAEAATTWPVVATCPDLPLLTVGNVLFLEDTLRPWHQISVNNDSGAIRRVASSKSAEKTHLFVLTIDNLHYSEDMGATWEQIDCGFPGAQIIDIASDATLLYILCTGGRVRKREIAG